MKHPLIIGAGGVASYLLPVLIKTFKPESITIIDKDVLEARNLDRQLFRPDDVGKSKAWALASMHGLMTGAVKEYTILEEWFSPATEIPATVDAIICCADNHDARNSAILAAQVLGCWAYIGGNEYVDSQVLAYHRDHIGTPHDILKRYPNIATDKTGSPFRCTGEAQEISPQLAMANLHCAAKLAHLMWVYERWLPGQEFKDKEEHDAVVENLPIEFYSSIYSNTSECPADLKPCSS